MRNLRPKHIIFGVVLLIFTGILAAIVEDSLLYPKSTNKSVTTFSKSTFSNDCDFASQENLFPWGDFGSGSDNILTPAPIPNLCPGHDYDAFSPPGDGEYTITNDISNWGDHAEIVWINIGDNSPDPEGYMMILNMHPDSGTVFQYDFEAFCEDATYEFSIDLLNLIIPVAIDWADPPDVDVYLNDQLIYVIGEVPQDGQWHTYTFTFSNPGNLDNMVLSLQSNNRGDAGRDMAIDNISLKSCFPTADIISTHEGDICHGENVVMFADIGGDYDINTTKIVWQYSNDNGLNWTDLGNIPTHTIPNIQPPQSGWYRYLTATTNSNLSAPACSIPSDTIMLNVVGRIEVTNDATICVGDSVMVGNNVYTEEDNYVDVLSTQSGCDSIVYTNIEILPLGFDSNYVVLCAGDYFFGSPFFADSLLVIQGCDSLIQIDVIVHEIYQDSLALELCEGELYRGLAIYRDTLIVDSLLTHKSCDSIIVAEITVSPTYELFTSTVLCNGEYHADNQYFRDTTLIDSLQTYNGCDSILTTEIKVNPVYKDTFYQSLCVGEEFEGSPYFQDEQIVYQYATGQGCDSIIVIELSVNPTYDYTLEIDLCEGEKYDNQDFLRDTTFTENLKTIHDCDSIVHKEISVHPIYRDTSFIRLCAYDLELDDPRNNDIYRSQSTDTLIIDTLQTSMGCDSLLYTSFRTFFHENFVQVVTLCENDTLFIGDNLYTEAGTYHDTISTHSGCDSIILTFLSVSSLINDTLDIQLCLGNTYEGIAYQSDTAFVKTVNNNTACDSIIYTRIHMQETSKDTVVLTLCTGENHQGNIIQQDTAYWEMLSSDAGCDSMIYHHIIALPSYAELDTIFLSESQFYEGQNYTNDTLFINQELSYLGCDSILQTQIIVLPSTSSSDSIYICQHEDFQDNSYERDTILVDSLIADNGADSLVYNYLFVQQSYEITKEIEICSPDSVFLVDAFQHQSGQYIDTHTSIDGCDSIIIHNLTVHPHYESVAHVQVCINESYLGNFYTQDTVLKETYMTVNQCDSTIITEIEVRPTYNVLDTIYINEGSDYQGDFFINDTLLIDNQSTIDQCDSILQTQIIIHPPLLTYDTIDLCAGTLYNGNIFLNDTTIVEQLSAINGADSIHHLSIYPVEEYRDSFVLIICEGDSVFLAGAYQKDASFYTDSFISSAGCDSIIVNELRVLPISTSAQKIEICMGEGIFVAGAFQTEASDYVDTLIAANGCDSLLTTTLITNPPIQIIIDTTLCEGDIYKGSPQFIDTTFIETLQQVNTCDSIVINIVNVNPIIKDTLYIPLQEGDQYNGVAYFNDTILVTQDFALGGCDSIHHTIISVFPEYKIEQDLFVCNGDLIHDMIIQKDTTIIDTLLTIWQTDSIVVNHIQVYPLDTTYLYEVSCIPELEGLFTEIYSNQLGCDSLIIKEVSLEFIYPAITIEQPSCNNEEEGSILFREIQGGQEPYLYGINEDAMYTEPHFQQLTEGDYKVHIQDSNGCEWDSLINIQAMNNLEIELENEYEINSGDQLVLAPLDIDSSLIKTILWFPAEGLSCTTCLHPTISPINNTAYTLTITTIDDCIVSDKIFVRVNEIEHVYIPSAFSPNGDNINDTFTIFADETIAQIQTMLIFDRWGNELFSRQEFLPNNTALGWDGNFQNKQMQQGVFIYYIEILHNNGKISIYKGDITIVF